MCEICLRTPCLSQCPNAPLPPVVCECEECGDPIYEGDLYYHIGEHKFCETCVVENREFAEIEQ